MRELIHGHALGLVLLLLGQALAADAVTVRFKQTDELFANPGKGWMAGPWRREPRFPASVAYFRLNWMDVEPAQGQVRWDIIDKHIRTWSPRGGRIAFRIMTANAHTKGYYCSPKWLFDLGCKSHDYLRGGEDTMAGGIRIKRIEPDYADPLFLKHHGRFIAELAKRYDGHPGVEFLDIGSYGIWGEWHTPNGEPWAIRKQIIDMYLDGFQTTPLVQMSDDAEALAYAISKGAGYRRDGVGSPWHEKTWIGSKKYAAVQGFAESWKKAPVVFEWFGPYDFLMRRKWSFDRAVDFMLENHVTLVNDNIGKFSDEALPQLHKLARLSGYRFVLREIVHPATVSPGAELRVQMKWANVGVGKLYRKHPLVLYLLDADGKTVARQEQKAIDPTRWLPGERRVEAALAVPATLRPGPYTLGIAFIDPHTKRPAIRLAIEAPHTKRLHRISKVTAR